MTEVVTMSRGWVDSFTLNAHSIHKFLTIGVDSKQVSTSTFLPYPQFFQLVTTTNFKENFRLTTNLPTISKKVRDR